MCLLLVYYLCRLVCRVVARVSSVVDAIYGKILELRQVVNDGQKAASLEKKLLF